MAVLCWPNTNPCIRYLAVSDPSVETRELAGVSLSAPASEQTLLNTDEDHGLQWGRAWLGLRNGPETESHRKDVRENTKLLMAEQLRLVSFGDNAFAAGYLPPWHADTTLFIDESEFSRYGSGRAGGKNLLGRYDAVCVKAFADYDMSWKPYPHGSGERSPFWVLHMAAINVGESARPSDFDDFFRSNVFDEDSYVGAMRRLFDNMVVVMATLRVEHFVAFPFGMGAFLRNLALCDRRYNDRITMQRLRRRVAAEFAGALARCPEPRACVHFACAGSTKHTAESRTEAPEGARNADAFLRAFCAADAAVQQHVIMYPGADCLELAQKLAENSRAVVMLNGANRTLLGNHWFLDGAKRAIDENLHRRSWTLAASSYLLNGHGKDGRLQKTRGPDELRRNVENVLKGHTFNFS
eukprot:TRINITY_DN111_c0_g2_i1.p1 TRINITY_DN111_c0_g2~~TRINITY_DN111_c0_g2_i1.p1  ORF type:complete len:435 (+),score=44.17 TRINITY_DN111_c0_g2_i1:74-1306(+)